MDRRTLLRTSVQLALLAPFARIAHALPNADARFVIVILRGALDGLAAVAPYGDSQYKSLRGSLALDSPGTTGGVLKLDGLFGLHPSLTSLHAMYQAKELAILHAVATPYRERSHFDAQKVLEYLILNYPRAPRCDNRARPPRASPHTRDCRRNSRRRDIGRAPAPRRAVPD